MHEDSQLQSLVRELVALPRETEWVEFKHNKAEPSDIGEYISALSNAATLYGPRQFSQMDRQERIRACYQHACLLYVSGKRMSNGSLRKRLGIKDSNYRLAFRIIRDTIESKYAQTPQRGAV